MSKLKQKIMLQSMNEADASIYSVLDSLSDIIKKNQPEMNFQISKGIETFKNLTLNLFHPEMDFKALVDSFYKNDWTQAAESFIASKDKAYNFYIGPLKARETDDYTNAILFLKKKDNCGHIYKVLCRLAKGIGEGLECLAQAG